jgi:hypothetical protein
MATEKREDPPPVDGAVEESGTGELAGAGVAGDPDEG